MAELEDAAQIIEVGLNGVNMAFRVSGAVLGKGIHGIGVVLELITRLRARERSMGVEKLEKMLKREQNLCCFQFDEKKYDDFKKLASAYGLLYSELPDLNLGDGKKEVLFMPSAIPRVNMILEKLKEGKIMTMGEYEEGGKAEQTLEHLRAEQADDKEIQKAVDDITKSSEEEKSVDDLKKMSDELDVSALKNDPSKVSITISEKMFSGADDKRVKTRIPYETDKYIWLDKKDVKLINDGKTILTFLEKDKEYELVDKDENVTEKIKGKDLYAKKYDPVTADMFLRKDIRDKRDKKKNSYKGTKTVAAGNKR